MKNLDKLAPFIVNAYVDSKFSINMIGKLFGVSERPIKRILLTNGVVLRKRGPIKGKQYRNAMFDELMEYKERAQ